MDALTVGAIVGAFASPALGYLAWRTAENGRKAKERSDENAVVIGAWKDLVTPIKDELARERAERKLDETEHAAVLAALTRQNEAMHDELVKLRREAARDRRPR